MKDAASAPSTRVPALPSLSLLIFLGSSAHWVLSGLLPTRLACQAKKALFLPATVCPPTGTHWASPSTPTQECPPYPCSPHRRWRALREQGVGPVTFSRLLQGLAGPLRALGDEPWVVSSQRCALAPACHHTTSCVTLGKSLDVFGISFLIAGCLCIPPNPLQFCNFLAPFSTPPLLFPRRPLFSETPAFCSGGEARKGGRASLAKTRPGRPRRQGPFTGESGRGSHQTTPR